MGSINFSAPDWAHHFSLSPKLPTLLILSSLSFLLWCIEGLFDADRKILKPRLSLLLCAVLVLLVLSTATAISPVNAFFGTVGNQGFLAYAAYVLLAFLILQLVHTPHELRFILKVIVFSALLSTIVPLTQIVLVRFDLIPYEVLGANMWKVLQAGGMTGNPDFTAVILAPAFLLSLAFLIKETRKGFQAYYLFASIVLGTVLVITQTRAAYLSVLIGLILLILVLTNRNTQTKKRAQDSKSLNSTPSLWKRLVLLATIVVTIVALGIIMTVDTPTMARKVLGNQSSAQTLDQYSGLRFTIWQNAVKVVGRYPVLGAGPNLYQQGHYPIARFVADPETNQRILPEDPHSYPLMIAATQGILMLVLLGGLVLSALREWVKQLKKGQLFQDARFVYLSAGIAFCATLINACFASATIPHSLLLFVLVALLLTPSQEKPLVLSGVLKYPLLVCAAVVFVGASLTSIRPLVADYYVQRFLISGSIDELDKAIKQTPWDYSVQEQWFVRKQSEIEYALPDERAGKMLSYDNALDKLISRHPYELGYYLRRNDIRLLAARNHLSCFDISESLALAQEQRVRFPELNDFIIAQAELLYYDGQKAQAEETLNLATPSLGRDIARLYWLIEENDEAGVFILLEHMKSTYPPSENLRNALAGAQAFR